MSRETRTTLYTIFIVILLLALGIAYAQVLSGTLEVQGEAEGEAQQGVFITDVEYYANNGADTANSSVDQFTGTTLKSKVTLGSGSSSSYTYKVTMYNNSDREYVFIGALTNKTVSSQYSNTNIDYNVESVTGLTGLEEYVTTIAPGEYITFPVTFTYTGTNTSNRVLNSYINFRFREVPIIELSNEGQTYTLEEISAGHVEEYEFTVSNYNQNYTNGVPLKYSFEAMLTEGCPVVAKIYDENGTEVTGSISMAGDGSSIDRTYTLKLTWDSSLDGREYKGQEYTCSVKLGAVPDDTDYADYIIEKEFGVEITTNRNTAPTLEVTVSDITSTTAKITATGGDVDGDSLQYTLEINGQTYGPSTTNSWEVTDLSVGKTYSYTVSVTDGYETVTKTGELTTECIHDVVQYIESTGKQYIDTGIIPDSNTEFELSISLNDVTSTLAIMGARNSNTKTPYFNMWIMSNKFRWDYYTSTTSVDFTVSEDNKVVITKEGNIISFETNGTVATINDNTTEFTSPYTLYLFNVHQTTAETRMAKMKLYYFKMYQNDVLVRDFIPALDDNGVACLYDQVTKQYFYNSGTGTFNYALTQVYHIFGDWEVTKTATCIEEGIQTRTCTVCGKKETKEIAIDTENGHNYVDNTCTICGTTQSLPITNHYVGYYADLTGDGTVDGVIFADQGYGQVGDGQWVDSNGNYTITKVTSGLKKYYVSQESYTGKFGTKPVISPVSGTTGTDRFYVMALTDFDSDTNYWYYSAAKYGMSDYSTYTSGNFGTGKSNTAAMITKWKASGYGTQNSYDIWGLIQDEVKEGWFVPSRGEWSAFLCELLIATLDLTVGADEYKNFGLNDFYWTSSQGDTDLVFVPFFLGEILHMTSPDNSAWLRLCSTF